MTTALIFRTELLARSETFIRSQAEALRTYRPFYVGWRRVNGLEISTDASWAANEGGLAGRFREGSFRLFGPNRGCVSLLRTLSPGFVHAHFGLDACAAMLLAKRLGVPLVVTFHGYDVTVEDGTMRQWRTGRKFLAQRSELASTGALFIAVSEFIRRRLLELGFPEDRIVVHYIGVDTKKFSAPENNLREPVVLFVARLVEKKGCSFLLRAMVQVKGRFPSARLVVIGDGPERNSLEKQAFQILPDAEFLGPQPPEVVRSWMTRASVFCVPSVTANNGDTEGFGIVFAEAQACGTPVVSFSTGGIPEAVAHGETGFLALEFDWQMLAAYIFLLLSNRDLWMRFSTAGRLRVETLFDLHRQTALLEDLYDQVSSPCVSRSGLKKTEPSLVST